MAVFFFLLLYGLFFVCLFAPPTDIRFVLHVGAEETACQATWYAYVMFKHAYCPVSATCAISSHGYVD